ncbi:MAG: hypothetical protein M3Q61_07530, partial [Chloroflexota bacterium]|nr:hypothetical protein [Chloroflexota bacterium]
MAILREMEGRPRIVVTRPVHEDALAMLRPRAEVIVGPDDPPIPDQYEVARLIKDADICYTLAANPVTAAAIGGATKLRLIASLATGF